MKAIQVSIDEELLSALDADEEVRREGRSAVLRRAAAAYLCRKRAEEIARRYREGYARGRRCGRVARLGGPWGMAGGRLMANE